MRAIQLLDISKRHASRALVGLLWVMAAGTWTAANAAAEETTTLDRQLAALLHQNAFTGQVESSLPRRLGRALDPNLVNVGRMLWFDTITGVHDDNTCGGCHSPSNGFGDTQSIAIGIQSNLVVGPDRRGPRNQRRTPKALNIAFFPALMWNGRFNSTSGNPFDNSQGFVFPPPESTTRFPPNDRVIRHLAQAQAEMPPTELTEVAGYTGTRGTPYSLGPLFDQFDDGLGSPLPPPDLSGYHNDPIRQVVLDRLNAIPAYVKLFGQSFPEVAQGASIDFSMFGRAIAEFEFSLTYANAPIDRFARGDTGAMTAAQKRGALLFFGKANCVSCHAVSGQANEMFSDFKEHGAGVPQIAPFFGVDKGNVLFDGPNADEDFGLEQISGNSDDRYYFRTAPLRDLRVQPAFFHNGSFRRLDDAVRFHLDTIAAAKHYSARRAGVKADLAHRLGPIEPVLQQLDPALVGPIFLSDDEFEDLVTFLRDGLADPRVTARNFCRLIPAAVPSGRPVLIFTGCSPRE
jgi:cytochrome c peroxidase